ncbi:RagB/SusD family nutrient uptake outer membrane protein [Algoriphagus sp. AGSA1]|uniref:RagB/SusD family nutrient uptake outer membrane protein n=1 Tax=Algoriphagus sp. AGSA1 TaxID=2907213 RepID=UPI001F200892|nr:RagB/SusD family nutrient uptake outer membrane protein [Algoriphagus sp. AGSA1]MCE7055216.1 RagB/SusD family nutrient uptake outer membrane protein [Algoriphagus sp. AGSA1]
MKNIKTILVLLITTLIFQSCNDDFLDREPLDAISDANFWQNEEQLLLAVNGTYAYVKGKNTVDMENMGDNTVWPTQTSYRLISSGNYNNDLGTLNTEWTEAYAGIRRCNHFLENYDKAEMTNEELKDRYAGEVRFIRAYLYSYLTFLFGDVPHVTQALNVGDPEIYGERNSREEIVEWILAELTAVAEDLPESYSSSDYGRITKGTALGWKSRVALFYQKFDVAEAAAKEVMDLGVYQLYPDYYELFTIESDASKSPSNRETMFTRIYTTDISMHNLSREIQVPDQSARWNPTKSLVDAYLCVDGKTIQDSPLYDESTYDSLFEHRDPRMKMTILSPGSPWGGREDGNPENTDNSVFTAPKFNQNRLGSVTPTGYYFTKYCDLDAVPTYNRDENDIIIMRYAEILLNYAEARLEQGTLTQEDLDNTINLLRERVNMHPMIISELQEWGMDLREEIRRERRVELVLEGQRYFDILRWKRGDLLARDVKGIKKDFIIRQGDVENVPTDEEGYIVFLTGNTFDESKHYLWPVPLAQRDLNPNLSQNPNW